MRKLFIVLWVLFISPFSFSQSNSSLIDPEAAELLQSSAAKYKAYPSIEAEFSLTIKRPKQKAEEPDSKYTEVQNGKVWIKGAKFKINMQSNEVVCDGKNIWTYIAKNKECQLNDFVESDDVFSPGKIFDLYQKNYAYRIKEKKVYKGKNITLVEMIPTNKKVSYFKIDAAVDAETKEILEVKIYERNGTIFFYTILRLVSTAAIADTAFVFDAKKFPGINVVDMR